jgi:hypothetical protein
MPAAAQARSTGARDAGDVAEVGARVRGKARTTLVPLPIEDNAQLIYTDLGAYTSQRFGTPCDDL